jgi:cation transport ATPase
MSQYRLKQATKKSDADMVNKSLQYLAQSPAYSNYYHADQQKINNLPMSKNSYMIEEYEKQKRQRLIIRRSIMDFSIGVLVMIVGVFLTIRHQFDLPFNQRYPPDIWDIILGVACFLYGGWRIYRGYKKNYFR